MKTTKREVVEYDIVIVGAGPAGLAAAIRLKQLAAAAGVEMSVCILEKGAEVGAHILSGAVIDPVALNALLPDWKARGAPLSVEVAQERTFILGRSGALHLPKWLMPRLMHNHGHYIVSLGNLCRFLAEQAEDMGVEIYPGFAGGDLTYSDNGAVKGVICGVSGIARDGSHKGDYQPGMEINGKYVFIAEGARGSLTESLIERFNLSRGRDPQKFGLGMKELWEVGPENHKPGQVTHTLGWPLGFMTGGGGFMYHMEDRLVSLGFVVHLDYTNPWLYPFGEFQRFKHHRLIRSVLDGGRRISYGARVISEGGAQSVPQLSFAGGVLIGCCAGVVNVPRVKGSHNAMETGMLAAETAFEAIRAGRRGDRLVEYEARYCRSRVGKELEIVRNVKPLWSRFGLFGGLILGGIDMWMNTLFAISPFGTLKHGKADCATLKPARSCRKISYPAPDGVIGFDILTDLSFSNTNHNEDQPVHLRLRDADIPIAYNWPEYGEPAQRYCPAGVYEVIGDGKSEPRRFQINMQNCLHCKTCDIKDPAQNITWTTPEGGGGPNYPNM
ncbi:MAG: electron transfer flavoprotein-ubiquinone oxidoreductase [Hyphomicrobiales bacterium]